MTPDGARIYVTESNISRVAVIDTATNTVTATLPIGWSPLAEALSDDGARLYVTEWGGGGEGNTVHIVDTVTNLELGTFSVGTTPMDISLGFVP
jgi:YVTN family beta-propeller protein